MENAMKNIIRIILLLTGVLALPLAAQPMAEMEVKKPIAQISHQGTGKVMAIDHEKLSIKLANDAIKSLGWPPMTMDFSVAKASLLDGLRAGDAVQFELRQAKSKKWDIVKIERM
jgi:Cu/Ag efflux protein CusF